MPITQIIDFSGIWSFWYWILVAVAWSMTSHFILGVPYDFVIRANREGGRVEQDCDELARINAERVLHYVNRGGHWIVGAAAFVLGGLATLGFFLGLEIAVGFFMILAPLTLVAFFSHRLALRIKEGDLRGLPLRRAITRRRFWNQFIGLCSILATVGIGMWLFLVSNSF